MIQKLTDILSAYFKIGDSYHYTLGRDKEAFAIGTMGLDDFKEYTEETVEEIAAHLIENGVTVPRWIPVEERLPTEDDADERGCVSVIHINGSKNIWHWSCADSILVTHWMPLLKGPEKEGTKLPDGKTCADCAKVRWCYSVGGVNHKNTSCNWEPIRFKPKEVQE